MSLKLTILCYHYYVLTIFLRFVQTVQLSIYSKIVFVLNTTIWLDLKHSTPGAQSVEAATEINSVPTIASN